MLNYMAAQNALLRKGGIQGKGNDIVPEPNNGSPPTGGPSGTPNDPERPLNLPKLDQFAKELAADMGMSEEDAAKYLAETM
jgi:hypothetical protein